MSRHPLPIDAHLDAIVRVIARDQGAVIVAEPGAGKTTRVPGALLNTVPGEILVLEPRRLAARLAAGFVASEIGEKVGGRVGYRVRFDAKTSKATRLTFMTEGILLRRLASDPALSGVGAVVFDELHERNLQADLALALSRAARTHRKRRKPLALIAMSATLDATPVCAFLNAEEVRVPGRSFPVEVRHADSDSRDLDARVAAAVRSTLTQPGGDVLVFLPGASEIRAAERRCNAVCNAHGAQLTTLHGRMKPEAQRAALRSDGPRRVILSTNVAESSVTLPRVTTVIDSGLERRAKHDPWSGLPSLVVERISQASAIQRAGRAGRVRAGVCLRLFTEADYRGRPAQTPPEVQRLDLAEWALALRALGHDPNVFPCLERPPADALSAADALLERLGATDEGTITERGRLLHSLPLHPRLGRALNEGCARGVGPRAATMVALLGERDVRRASRDRPEMGSADVLHTLELLEAALAEDLGSRELRARGFDVDGIRQVDRVRSQLARTMRIGDEIEASFTDEEEDLRLAILAGFSDRVGTRDGRRVVFVRGGAASLDESSVVRSGRFVAALGMRTDRKRQPIITSGCEIEAEMFLELFPDLIEEQSSVRFDAGTEQVERVESMVFDGLVLDESVRRDVVGPDVAAALAKAALDAGLGRFFDLDALEAFRLRVEFARSKGAALDAVDDESIEVALRALCEHRRSFRDLRGENLIDALRAQEDPAALKALARLAPIRVSLRGRRNVTVNYEVDRPPWIASRLQDFFGMNEGPSLGGEPLVLHLLAPNRRAVQVTTDLAGFWERHYPALRRQLMRRYSRHAWPEDPS